MAVGIAPPTGRWLLLQADLHPSWNNPLNNLKTHSPNKLLVLISSQAACSSQNHLFPEVPKVSKHDLTQEPNRLNGLQVFDKGHTLSSHH